MNSTYVRYIIIIFGLTFLGCSDKLGFSDTTNEINKLKKDIDKIKTENRTFLYPLKDRIEHDDSIALGVSKGYQLLTVPPYFTFFISVSDLKQHANGYKIILEVGNLYTAIFTDCKINIKWGEAWDTFRKKDDNYGNWLNSLKNKDEIIEKLLPGIWNEVTIGIYPAKAEETGYLEMSMDLGKVSLIPYKLRQR
jgi:hypothetical protein